MPAKSLHPAFPTAPLWDQPLWRYLPAARLLDMLKQQYLYVRRLDLFDDQYEGTIGLHDPAAESSPGIGRASRTAKEIRKMFFVSCWSEQEHESELMWRTFGNIGVATVTSFDRLRVALPEETYLSRVNYVPMGPDHTDEAIVRFELDYAITKRIEYRAEREVRVIYWPRSKNYKFHDSKTNTLKTMPDISTGTSMPGRLMFMNVDDTCPDDYKLSIDWDQVIDRVVLSPKLSPDEASDIRREVNSLIPGLCVDNSVLTNDKSF